MSCFPGTGPGGPLVAMEMALASLPDWHFRKGTWGGQVTQVFTSKNPAGSGL